MKKSILAIILTLVMVLGTMAPFSVAAAGLSVGTELLTNGGFETVSNSAPTGFGATGGWGGNYISLVSGTGNTHSGNYAVKFVTTNGGNPFISQDANGILGGCKYKLSFWYKGTVSSSGFSVKFEQYNSAGYVADVHSETYKTAANWTYVEYEFYAHKDATRITVMPRCYSPAATIYFDDISFTLIEGPKQFTLDTDWIFYYENYNCATATLTMDEFYEDPGYTVDFKVTNGSTTVYTDTGKTFTDNRLVYKADITSLAKKTEYTLTATVKDSGGNVVGTESTKICRIDRPENLTKDGVYMMDGKPFEPVYAYHFDLNDAADALDAGVNVIQWAATNGTNKELCLQELDRLQSLGLKAAVVCYWGMQPAGHPNNASRIQNFVNMIKDHPAVFCYMVMDEPFSHYPAEECKEYLYNSYKIIRTIDDKHPVYLCEDNIDRYATSAKYVDILGTDPYPRNGLWTTHVADCVTAAVAGARGEKPVYTLVQAFSWVNGTPTPAMLRTQLVQAMSAGAQAVGYYTWVPDDPTVDQDLNEGRYWDTMLSFHEKDQPHLYSYFGRKANAQFNRYHGADYWYESWAEGNDIYLVLLNRTTAQKTANIPLVSDNGNVVLSSYNVENVNGGNVANVTKGNGSMTVAIEGYGAALYKITPTDSSALSGLSDIGINGSFEKLTNGVLDQWSFSGTTQAAALKTDGGASGNNYVSIPASARADITIGGDKIKANKTYIFEFSYKQAGTDGFVTVETTSDYTKFYEKSLPATGTTASNATWQKYSMFIHTRGKDSTGLNIRLRNGADANVICYDDIKITEMSISDTANIIPDGSFETTAVGESPKGWSNINSNAANFAVATGGAPDGNNFISAAGTQSLAMTAPVYIDYMEGDRYKLSFDFSYPGGGMIASIKVKMYFADGTSSDVYYRGYSTHFQRGNYENPGISTDGVNTYNDCWNILGWGWYNYEIDLADQMSGTDSPVKAFEVQLNGGNSGGSFDNVRIYEESEFLGYALGENLIANPGFDVKAGEVPAGWSFVGVNGAEAVTEDGGIVLGTGNRAEVEISEAEAGKAYLFSVSYKSANGGSAYVCVESLTDFVKILDKTYGASADYSKITAVIMTTPEDKDGLLLRLRNHPGGTSDVYYDNVSFKEIIGYDNDNLVFNGSFEYDGETTGNPMGWRNVNTGAANYTITAQSGSTTASDGNYFATTGANQSLRLESPIRVSHESDTGYALGFDFSYPGGGGMPSVWVRMNRADGTHTDVTYRAYSTTFSRGNYENPGVKTENGGTVDDCWNILGWGWYSYTLDLGDQVAAGTSPVKSIDIQINGGNVGGSFDNVSLEYKINEVTVVILDENGKAVDSIAADSSASYTAEVIYHGTDRADVYLAVYNKSQNGVMRLEKVVGAPIDKEQVATDKIEGIDTVGGNKIIKAFVLDSENRILAVKEIKSI